MISVVMYGRNDSHGYNLHKRAAISFNAIAELLVDPDDEIVFVDYRSSNDVPTFPEAIRDTLTPRAQKLIRVIRVRPHIHRRERGDSPLPLYECLSRNIGIRRMNPNNRWILSTNPDMVFVPLIKQSLSQIVADLEDGYYALPRLEMSETFWESVDRKDPRAVMRSFKEWGERYALNEVVRTYPEQLFDGPGDFQLFPKKGCWDIGGFNESMVYGWHVDSNLCKRFHLHYGRSRSLESELLGYHCDHTRVTSSGHSGSRSQNSLHTFFYDVTSPFLPDQGETWGLPGERFEEIGLDDAAHDYLHGLQEVIEAEPPSPPDNEYTHRSYGSNSYYDTIHAFPYIADNFTCMNKDASVVYLGENEALSSMLSEYLAEMSFSRPLASLSVESVAPDAVAAIDADVVVFDMHCAPETAMPNRHGLPVGKVTSETMCATIRRMHSFLSFIAKEQKSQALGIPARKILAVSLQSTIYEHLLDRLISFTAVPFSCHFRHGFVRTDADVATALSVFSLLDAQDDSVIVELYEHVLRYCEDDQSVMNFPAASLRLHEACRDSDVNDGGMPYLVNIVFHAMLGVFDECGRIMGRMMERRALEGHHGGAS